VKPDARLGLGDSLLLKKDTIYIKAEELSCLDVIAYKLTAAYLNELSGIRAFAHCLPSNRKPEIGSLRMSFLVLNFYHRQIFLLRLAGIGTLSQTFLTKRY